MKKVEITYYNNIASRGGLEGISDYKQPDGSYSIRNKDEFLIDDEDCFHGIAEYLDEQLWFWLDDGEGVETLKDLIRKLKVNNMNGLDDGSNLMETMKIDGKLVFEDDEVTELIEDEDLEFEDEE